MKHGALDVEKYNNRGAVNNKGVRLIGSVVLSVHAPVSHFCSLIGEVSLPVFPTSGVDEEESFC
jgi:hypothetical protein